MAVLITHQSSSALLIHSGKEPRMAVTWHLRGVYRGVTRQSTHFYSACSGVEGGKEDESTKLMPNGVIGYSSAVTERIIE
jgi:hypothetical protein